MFCGGFWAAGVQIAGGSSKTGHAYSLFTSPDTSALFILRNPWGSDDVGGSYDGALTMYGDDVYNTGLNFVLLDPGEAANFGDGVLDGYSWPYDL